MPRRSAPRLCLSALALAILAAAPAPTWAMRRGAAGEGEAVKGEGLVAAAGEGGAGFAGPGDLPEFLPEGVAVELVDSDRVPAKVKVIIHSRGLANEYNALMKALSKAPKGRMQALKCSALYRSLYIGGHEAAFRAKDVNIFLTKESGGVTKPSILKLWFVDRTIEEAFVPAHVYTDGMLTLPKSKYTALFRNLSSSGGVPLAAAAQPYDGFVNADKSSMPVDVLKLVESKGADAMRSHMNLAAEINIGDGSALWAAYMTEIYRLDTMKKGLDIYFTQSGTEGRIEYYDMDMVDSNYRPPHRYSKHRIIAYEHCLAGKRSPLTPLTHSAQHYSEKYYDVPTSTPQSRRCREKVAGSIPRESSNDGCKCAGDNMAVFCGPQKVAGRKFGLKDSLGEACKEGHAVELYCAEQACRMPHW